VITVRAEHWRLDRLVQMSPVSTGTAMEHIISALHACVKHCRRLKLHAQSKVSRILHPSPILCPELISSQFLTNFFPQPHVRNKAIQNDFTCLSGDNFWLQSFSPAFDVMQNYIVIEHSLCNVDFSVISFHVLRRRQTYLHSSVPGFSVFHSMWNVMFLFHLL
jgi:hypothetical protein